MSQPEIALGIFVANTAFTGTPFRFVKLSGGKLVLCGAGEAGLGVIQDTPVANEAGNVMCFGVSKVLAGGTISQGNTVKSDASGQAVAAGASDPFAFGMALESANSGEYFEVFLLGRGGDSNIRYQAVSAAVAAGSDGGIVAARVGFDSNFISATYVPFATITGANTNTRTISVINKGAAGSGSAVPASLALTSGVNASAFVEKALTNSGTGSDLVLTAGDILEFASVHAASGLADPGGLVVITVQRR